MTLELWLMIVSGAGMAGILAHGYLAKAKGLRTALHDMSAKTDPILSSIEGKASRAVSGITLRNIVLALNRAFVVFVRFFIEIFRMAHDGLHRMVEKASRKTEDLSRSGAASFYLKKIKEGKEETREL